MSGRENSFDESNLVETQSHKEAKEYINIYLTND